MSKASNVVASVTQQSEGSTVSDRVQRTPEGHTSSVGTTYVALESNGVCLFVDRRTRRLSSRSPSNSRPPLPTRRPGTSRRCRCRWAGRRPRCVATWSMTTTTTWTNWQGCLPHQWRRVWFDRPACRRVYPNYRPAAACRPPVDTITWPALTNQMTSSINSTASRSLRKSSMTHT